MKTKIIFFCLAISSLSALSQDVEFINLNSDWVRMNPAYAGSNKGFRAQVNNNSSSNSIYRNQLGISSDYYLKGIKSGIAISANQADLFEGFLKESTLNFAYSKHITIVENKLVLLPALQVGVIERKLDVTALSFSDLLDPRFENYFGPNFPTSSKHAMDINTGLLLQIKKDFVVGFAARHVSGPDLGLSGYKRMPQKYVLHASYDKVFNDRNSINISAFISTQNKNEEAKLQVAMVLFKHLYCGVGAGTSNNYYVGSMVAGYKGHFWNATILFGSNFYPETKYSVSSTQLSLAATIRDKEQRRKLTAMHSW